MKPLNLFLLLIFFCEVANCQTDTILAYDLNNTVIGTITPVAFNATVTADHGPSSTGSLSGIATLPSTPPTTNTFSNSSFSKLAYASSFFTLTDYPVRTVINLRSYKDSMRYVGTGMMVGPCFVLTSAFNVYDFGSHGIRMYDSLLAIPALNNGLTQPGLLSSRAKKIFVFKSFLGNNTYDDIALIQLEDPIGLQLGWTGIGFDANQNFTNGKVYHKFSYPSVVNPFDSTKVYNGDTLYYNYGSIAEQSNFLEVPSNEAQGIPGQGGSTFLYKDNADYYSVGLFSYSTHYYHYRITNKAFYQMNNVLNTQSCSTVVTSIKENSTNKKLLLYPNPVLNEATLQFDYDPSQHYSLKIIDQLGRQVRDPESVSSGTVRILREDLSPGIYFVHLQSNSQTIVCQMAVGE
jgi:hypothetical protein